MQERDVHINIPKRAKYIIETIEAAGYEAYVVGGCVRDSILGRTPEDWDITTSARPEEVKRLFRRTIDTGIEHGTVTVMLDKEGFEVTTYRVDGKYEDSRHPKEVTFTPNLEEDLKRRDFTINAMAYNDSQGLQDIFGGIEDLEAGRIRCVGEPTERFSEDALRILRGVRFSAQLGFTIDPATRAAMKQLAPSLVAISAERIQTELVKLLVSPHPEQLREAWRLGITAQVLPEFDACMATPQHNPHHCYSVGEHILHAVTEVPQDKVLRLTMLLHDIGKPQVHTTDEQGIDHFYRHEEAGAELAGRILRRLKFDNETLRRVKHLVRVHGDCRDELTPRAVRRAVYRIGEEAFPDYLQVRRADILAQDPAIREEKLERLARLRAQYEEILEAKNCLSLKDLAVGGRDLIEAGVPAGPGLGALLDEMLREVIENPEHNTREYLLTMLDS